MKMAFQVTYTDGRTVEVEAMPKDVVAFERQYGKRFTDAFSDTPALEWLFYLAWSPLHRSKQDPRAFDEFLDDVADIEVVEDSEAVAPFPTAPSEGTSPGSPSLSAA
jgi:hypothetical protein